MDFKPELLSLLTHENPKVRENALDEIEGLGYQGFVEDIKPSLKDSYPDIRNLAHEIIERWKSPDF